MKKTIKYIMALSIGCLFMCCENFVDVPLPSSQLTGAKVFEDPSTAEAAMVDVYSKLRDTGILTGLGGGASVNLGLYADELANYSAEMLTTNMHNNELLPDNGIILTLWNDSYHQIYCCNAVIEGLEKSSSIPEAAKEKLTGEALFTRALIHFYLANIFGDIPYIKGTDYEKNRKSVRTESSQVYQYIIEDLNNAVSLLPADYITAERGRPNKFAAYALLARAYLYSKEWEKASNAASAVLNSPLYKWENDPDLIFLKTSTSTIWQFMPKRAGNNTDEAAMFIFNSGPPLSTALDPKLISAFEDGDLRRLKWTRTINSTSGSWQHAYKYKKNAPTATSVEYSIVLRTAEQHLIRSEARARQGDLIGAKEDLNKIRRTAGLPNTPAQSAEEIINAVIKERRVELFTEYGHRFFDLKRTGQLDAVLGSVKKGWNPTDNLWPIPEKELISNPFLSTQNPGY